MPAIIFLLERNLNEPLNESNLNVNPSMEAFCKSNHIPYWLL